MGEWGARGGRDVSGDMKHLRSIVNLTKGSDASMDVSYRRKQAVRTMRLSAATGAIV